MSSHDEIANRIAEIIISPDSAIGLIHGILSVPVDLGYLAYGYFDSESRYSNQTETIRIVQAIDNGILNYDRITDAIQIIFKQFDKYVSESKQNKIYSHAIYSVAGRVATNSFLSGKIATAICGQASVFITLRGGLIGNILLAGGMTERCIRTSEKLSIDEPEVYEALRVRNYDLLYFMFEPALKPFVDALTVRRIQGISAFKTILNLVESKVNSHV